MKQQTLNDDRSQWIDNDEGLYNWWRSSRQSKSKFIRENRAELTRLILEALNRKPANGDITKDAELSVRDSNDQNLDVLRLLEALKSLNQKAKSLNNLQHAGVEIDPALWSDLYQTSEQVDAIIEKVQD